MGSRASSHLPWTANPMIIVFQDSIALSIAPHVAYNSNTAFLTNKLFE
ncbi:hypothetical protein ACJIZ3_008219 [Penstemon smallii]|uniref:Uncharacterized protein n=1 Tax=Penstemon smallii TaxID=265156 RepID=A0ABD3TA61_9LAMI